MKKEELTDDINVEERSFGRKGFQNEFIRWTGSRELTGNTVKDILDAAVDYVYRTNVFAGHPGKMPGRQQNAKGILMIIGNAVLL